MLAKTCKVADAWMADGRRRRNKTENRRPMCTVPPINLQDDAASLGTLIFQIKRLMVFNKNFTAHLSVDTLAQLKDGTIRRGGVGGGGAFIVLLPYNVLSYKSCPSTVLPLIHQYSAILGGTNGRTVLGSISRRRFSASAVLDDDDVKRS